MSFLAIIIFFAVSCTAFEDYGDDPGLSAPIGDDHGQYHHYTSTPPATWGDNLKILQHRQIYFSGNPNKTTFLYGRANGISLIIDLRVSSNLDETQTSGIKVLTIPTAQKDLFHRKNIERLSNILETTNPPEESQRILLIHKTPNEAVALYSAYLFKHSNLNEKATLSIAKSIGLADGSLEKELKKYLQTH
jgi:hypothetical protein